MSIPTLTIPEYTVKLYSLPKPVKIRPYLVGEEKILMLAQQGEDPKEIRNAVEQILRICTFEKVDISKLPSFDLEYLYLQLRAKSVNNIVQVNYRCRNRPVDGEAECGNVVPVNIDLNTIAFKTVPEHTNKIWLNDQVGVTLAYPSKEIIEHVQAQNGVFGIDLLVGCLRTIFTKAGEVHEVSEADPAEIEKFIASLSVSQFAKVQTFFDTMPTLTHSVAFECKKCGFKQDLVVSGLMDFFV